MKPEKQNICADRGHPASEEVNVNMSNGLSDMPGLFEEVTHKRILNLLWP
jgi:hypothetical protein